MKSMKLIKWKAIGINGKETQESIINVLTLILNRASNDVGKGIDMFRFLHRISESFNKAEKTGVLEIEDGDYLKLSGIIEKHVVPQLAFSADIYSAIEDFLKL